MNKKTECMELLIKAIQAAPSTFQQFSYQDDNGRPLDFAEQLIKGTEAIHKFLNS